MWYVYTMEHYSAIKRMNDGICIKVDGPRDYHTKGSKSEKGKYCTVSLTCVI